MKKQMIVSGATTFLVTQIVVQSACLADLLPYHNRPRPQPPVEEPKEPITPTTPAKKADKKTKVDKTATGGNKTKKEISTTKTTK